MQVKHTTLWHHYYLQQVYFYRKSKGVNDQYQIEVKNKKKKKLIHPIKRIKPYLTALAGGAHLCNMEFASDEKWAKICLKITSKYKVQVNFLFKHNNP